MIQSEMTASERYALKHALPARGQLRAERQRRQIAQEILSFVVALAFLLPLGFLLLGAFKAQREVFNGPVIPEIWVWQNFVEAWNGAPFLRYFFNSMLVSVIVTVVVIFTSSLAAFAFSNLEFLWGFQKRLAQQKHSKRAGAERHDQCLIRILPTKLPNRDEVRNQQHIARNHQRSEREQKQQRLARKLEVGKGERGEA
jgi:hypothetical protein